MKTTTLVGAFAALALLGTGCSDSSSVTAAAARTLTMSGKLGGSARSFAAAADNSAMAVDTTNLKIKAIAFTTPPTIVESDVAANGSFSIAIPNAKGAAVTYYIIDKSDDSQQGVIVFEDAGSKDMNGNTSQSSSVVLNGSVNLGSIQLGTDGKIKVAVATIASQIGSSTTGSVDNFDPTGVWYMKAFDGTVPTGYSTVGACIRSGGGGPCVGFPITLSRFTGKAFTKATNCDSSVKPVVCATTDGSIGTADRFALSIWGGNFADGMGACGSKTGFTADEARAYAGIHIASLPTVEGNALSFGPYVYGTPTGFGGDAAPFNKAWMRTGATLTHDLQDCRPTVISNNGNNFNGWACKSNIKSGSWPGSDTGSVGWNIGVEGGGCFNSATNKPVNVTNWSAMGIGTCANSDVSATYGAGFMKNTCTFTGVDHDNDGGTPTINLSCTNTGGQFTNVAGNPSSTPLTISSGQYLGQPTPLAVSGATCASIGSATDSQKIAAYRCYAEALWNGATPTGSTCTRNYNFNWAATNPNDFAQDSERGKPKNAFITNILSYNGNGQTATLEDEEIETITVNTGASSSTFCKASRRTVISFKKISETRMLVDLRQGGQMNSTNAACIGAAKDALSGKNVGGGDLQHILTPENLIFYADTAL